MPYEAELTGTAGDAAAIIDTARKSVQPYQVDDGADLYIIRTGSGDPKLLDVEATRNLYRDHPRRISGHPTVDTHTAFEQYVKRHETPEIELWADERRNTVTAVFDSHTSEQAGWGEHRVTLQLRTTLDWQTWAGHSGKMMPQGAFAEFIEDNVVNVVNPTAADMLELAQSFQAKSGVVYESSRFLDSGHRQLEYREQVDAKAGRKGQLDIPTEIELALQPFVGLDTYRVKARFRYRIHDGDLTLGYKLDRPDDVLLTAFGNVVEQVGDDLGMTILSGRPW